MSNDPVRKIALALEVMSMSGGNVSERVFTPATITAADDIIRAALTESDTKPATLIPAVLGNRAKSGT